jgi:hypothetical protein
MIKMEVADEKITGFSSPIVVQAVDSVAGVQDNGAAAESHMQTDGVAGYGIEPAVGAQSRYRDFIHLIILW